MDQMLGWLTGQIEMVGVDKKIRGRVKQQMEKSQREYYLNEQMKAIQKELDNGEDGPSEIEQLQAKVDDAGMSAEAKKKAESEIKKLKMMSPMSAEATVVRSYIDWMLSVPGRSALKVKHDISRAERVLQRGTTMAFDEVKERILEFLAVQKKSQENKDRFFAQ